MEMRTDGTPDAGNASPFRLLLVDDDDAVLFGFREYLLGCGFVVDTASRREEAEALLAERSYDAVVSDLRLSGVRLVEGLDIVSAAQLANPRPFVVLISAYLTPQIEAEAISRGADRILNKPLSPVAIVRQLRTALKSKPCLRSEP